MCVISDARRQVGSGRADSGENGPISTMRFSQFRLHQPRMEDQPRMRTSVGTDVSLDIFMHAKKQRLVATDFSEYTSQDLEVRADAASQTSAGNRL